MSKNSLHKFVILFITLSTFIDFINTFLVKQINGLIE